MYVDVNDLGLSAYLIKTSPTYFHPLSCKRLKFIILRLNLLQYTPDPHTWPKS